ncbi:ABC transporter permease [Pararhizobium sp. YC-54]|uniref:ABC transporter permease n=1 Tax=Pararhizobium sp. YC-54 TaxID=2986920 RepID=UPI0021F7AAD4|nr:ABC transporter permease [Pararhizobium sp. YC-54]MCW0001364.1 ABC transporter permease [Pararhizobium sp. YC-54]
MNTFSFSDLLRRPESGAVLGLLFVLVFFVIFGSVEFLKPAGAASWLNVAANLGIVAIPVGLLMISGELDISIGAMIPAGALTVGIISGQFGLPIWVGIAGALGLGVIVGLINGLLVVNTAVPSLIVTLGTLFAVQGLALGFSVLLTGTTSVALSPAESGAIAKALFGQFIGGGFQVTIFWWLLFTAVYVFYVHYSPFGNWLFAMGGDRVSARNAGIPTDKLTITLFVLSSVSAAFVGMCQAILFNVAQVSAGMTFIFNSIISVVVGGVLLTGGFGSVIGIFLGTITFAIVNQGIYFTSFDRNWSSLIIGAMLLLAVLMNNTFRIMALTYSPKKK